MLSPNLKTDVHVPHSQLGEHMLPCGETMGNPEAQTAAVRYVTVSFSPSHAASLRSAPYVD